MDNKKSPNTNGASRFSRRRFIQTAASASPILLAFKSPASWGVTSSFSSTAMLTSLNASEINRTTIVPKTSDFWLDAFEGRNDTVKNLLANENCFYDSLLLPRVSSGHSQFQYNETSFVPSREWRYYLSSFSEPRMLPSLQNQETSITVLFYRNIENRRVNKAINIIEHAPNFIKNLSTAHLNSLFYPTINHYSPEQLQMLYNDALENSITSILQDLDSGLFIDTKDKRYSQSMQILNEALSLTY